jgi:YHS domain-containing protein
LGAGFFERKTDEFVQLSGKGERAMEIDPVCGMEVSPESAAATYEYKGKMYFFCAPGCKAAFEKDPEKYLSGAGNHDGKQGHHHG